MKKTFNFGKGKICSSKVVIKTAVSFAIFFGITSASVFAQASGIKKHDSVFTVRSEKSKLMYHYSPSHNCATFTVVNPDGVDSPADLQLRDDAEQRNETIRIAVVTHKDIHLDATQLKQRSDSLSHTAQFNGVSAIDDGITLVATGLTFDDTTFSENNTSITTKEVHYYKDGRFDDELKSIIDEMDAPIILMVVPNDWTGPQDVSIVWPGFNSYSWKRSRLVISIKETYLYEIEDDVLYHGILHTMGLHSKHEKAPSGLTNKPFHSPVGWTIGNSGVGGYHISGGTQAGVGPDGEDMVGWQKRVGAIMLEHSPNLKVDISAPDSTVVGDPIHIDFAINKELSDTLYNVVVMDADSNLVYSNSGSNAHTQWTPDKPGTYHIVVTVTNSVGWQSDDDQKDVVVSPQPNQAPVAQCKHIQIEVASDGSVTVHPDDIDDGSYDPDGDIVDKTINGGDEVVYTTDDKGENPVTLDVEDDKGSHTQCETTVTVDFVSSTTNTDDGNNIKIYPNPAKTVIHISNVSSNNHTYKITDIMGQTVDKGKLVGSTINVAKLQTGIYLLEIVEKSELSIIKFRKE